MSTPSTNAQRKAIATQIAAIDHALPGTLNIAYRRCGKPRCRCHHDPPQLHGPYLTWTRKVAGKTITRQLNPDQAERYRPWIENNQRLRELITQLQALTLNEAEQTEAWRAK